MKNFIFNLFSNRFGILLATLNVCYFMSKDSFFSNHPFGKVFLCANFPAVLSTVLSLEFVKFFFHGISFSTERFLGNTFFPFFCVFQWLFVAWIAKTLAAKIRPNEL